jgi:hypothetical protein
MDLEENAMSWSSSDTRGERRRFASGWRRIAGALALVSAIAAPPGALAASPAPQTNPGATLSRYEQALLLEKAGKLTPGSADPGLAAVAPSAQWLAAKNAESLVGPDGVRIDSPLAAATSAALSTTYTRWIIEPLGGSWFDGDPGIAGWYTDKNYWNECTAGASAVAMGYWQIKYGFPNVSGMSGFRKEPYTSWPSGYPTFRNQSSGSYFGGTDSFEGYTSYARGYIQYMSMSVSTPGLAHPGIDEFFNPTTGAQEYPQGGGTPSKNKAALNYESAMAFWAYVPWSTGNLAATLRSHVGSDIGVGLPVIARVDAGDLPNWAGLALGKVEHAVTIVGYNDTTLTYTYLDSCGTSCNNRPGNQNGGVYSISQAKMAQAMIDGVGDGFIW